MHVHFGIPPRDVHVPPFSHSKVEQGSERKSFNLEIWHRILFFVFDGRSFSFHELHIPVQVPLLQSIKLLGHSLVFEHEILWQPTFQGSPSKISGHLHVGIPFLMIHSVLFLQ